MSQFIYLLNAFEQASQSDNPSLLDYARKRKALLEHVEKLESARPEALRSIPAELAHFMAGLFSKCHELEFNGQTLDRMLDVEGYLREQAGSFHAHKQPHEHRQPKPEDGALRTPEDTTPQGACIFFDDCKSKDDCNKARRCLAMPTPIVNLAAAQVAYKLGKGVRKWHRLKEDKGDTEYHIVKDVLQNWPVIEAALHAASIPSPLARSQEKT